MQYAYIFRFTLSTVINQTKEQILKEFLNAFVIGGLKDDGMISREQFDDYYSNIGASIDSEDYFELMIR